VSEEAWKIVYTRQGLRDKQTASEAGFANKIQSLLEIIKNNPYEPYPPVEKLVGDLSGAYSRRINRQHRLIYQIYKEEHIVKIVSLWTHYE